MVIVSRGYSPSTDELTAARDFALFKDNLTLLLENASVIMHCADYFFCEPSFAWCSWPYMSGGGKLPIGYLLLSWRCDFLIGTCPHCNGMVLVTSFGGSPLSGTHSWAGLCQTCSVKVKGRWTTFHPQMSVIQQLRKEFPTSVTQIEEFDGNLFDWVLGLKPSRKTREIQVPVAQAVPLQVLIKELRDGKPRQGQMPNVSKISGRVEFTFETS